MHKLEKLNSSIDIIPLQISNMDNSNNAARRLAIGKPTADKPRQVEDPSGRVPMRDPMIISRVRTYLYENEDKVYIDVTEMADCLQRKYRDYRGKKRGPFRAMVRKAYDEITENLTRQADSHWQEDDDDIDIEVDAMPSDYLQAYKRQLGKQNGNSSDKELIDISSDDDQVPNNATKSNKDAMEIEHVSKKPHLSPSVESVKAVQQPQEFPLDGQSKNRPERTRKRLREKENDNTQELTNIKKKYRDIPVVNPTISFHDFGGNAKVLETVANLLLHIKHPEVYIKLNISPPRGFLLHGPPGCGKTLLAHAIAGELKIPLLKVAAPELVAGVSGESEQRIRELFEQAIAIAPCILFLDEIDAIAPHRATAQKEMERRMVSQLLSCLDELGMKDNGTKVLVVGATNRPDAIDPALRRAGRFDREVSLGIPDREARSAILETLTAVMPLYRDVNLEKVAALTPGFVGADLVALIREAAMAAVNRVFDIKKTVPVPALPPAVTPDSSVPATENKIAEEEEEKPVSVPEQDVSDIIIEDDIPAKVDTTDPKADQKEVEVVSTEEEKASTSEEQKQPEKLAESSEVVESTVEQPEVSSVAGPSSVTEIVEPEPAPVVETTDVPIVSSENTSAELAEVQESTVEIAVESVLPMQVDKIDKVKSEPRREEVGRTLEDIRALLHDEPPLTAEQLEMLCITQQDFDIALKNVQPSAKREGFATVPDVTWDDVGSLQDIREELQMTILAPIRHADHFASLGLNTPTGVLLCGPPGCGKTLLAKAIANEAGINFISVKGPELLNMYVGESEKAVRQCFLRARNSAPCVIFFDELDALCPKRSEGDSTATSRVVNQMLTEMDGVEGRKNVFLMAASNRPDIIDPAVLRPGRLDKILYVGLPNPHDRVDILRALTKNGTKPKLAADVDIETVATSDRLDGYTGADIAAFVREAGVEALREIMSGLPCPAEICARHLDAAFEKIRPSVQDKDIKHYEKLQKLYSVKKKSLNTDVPMSLEPEMDSTMEAMET